MESPQDIQLNVSDRMDQLEETILAEMEVVAPDMIHTFYPGIYRREIKMDKGMLLTSRIHKTIHPYFVMTGIVEVFSANERQNKVISAPFMGTTMPGERRALYIHEDCLWVTVHAIPYVTGDENEWNEADKQKLLERIEADLLEPHLSSISGRDMHEVYQKRVLDSGLKLTF